MYNRRLLSPVFLLQLLLFLLPFHMEVLRVGSLNFNMGRNRHKCDSVAKTIQQKKVHVAFLQENHSGVDNEVEWMMWWVEQQRLSHGTNLSAGVTVLISSVTRVNILHTGEVRGRLLVVKTDLKGCFLFN